ncbi:MAG: sigma-70 family RNA polymerase sigma factor [Polyangiales bacterium]
MGLSIMSNWLRPATPSVAAAAPPSFAQIYEEHLDFVWRVARRLGVPEASIDDAVQDVFLVVHDRLASFEGRSSLRTWLYGIVRRVARDHRPSKRERPLEEAPEARCERSSAHEGLERAEAKRLLHALLDTLDDDKREVFVLAELEEMPMPEVAQAIGINVNTAHARLRAARHQLEDALARLHARQTWRSP